MRTVTQFSFTVRSGFLNEEAFEKCLQEFIETTLGEEVVIDISHDSID